MCTKLTTRGPAEFQGSGGLHCTAPTATGGHFHRTVSVLQHLSLGPQHPLQKGFGLSFRRFNCEVVHFEDCPDVNIQMLLMLLQPFACYIASCEARREPGPGWAGCRASAIVHPETATGGRPAPTGKATLQGTPRSQVTSCSLCGCRLLLFTISSSTSSRPVSHSPAFLFLTVPWAWVAPFPHC